MRDPSPRAHPKTIALYSYLYTNIIPPPRSSEKLDFHKNTYRISARETPKTNSADNKPSRHSRWAYWHFPRDAACAAGFAICATLIVSPKNLSLVNQDQKSWKNRHKYSNLIIYRLAKVRSQTEPNSPIGRFRPSMATIRAPMATAQCTQRPPEGPGGTLRPNQGRGTRSQASLGLPQATLGLH